MYHGFRFSRGKCTHSDQGALGVIVRVCVRVDTGTGGCPLFGEGFGKGEIMGLTCIAWFFFPFLSLSFFFFPIIKTYPASRL